MSISVSYTGIVNVSVEWYRLYSDFIGTVVPETFNAKKSYSFNSMH